MVYRGFIISIIARSQRSFVKLRTRGENKTSVGINKETDPNLSHRPEPQSSYVADSLERKVKLDYCVSCTDKSIKHTNVQPEDALVPWLQSSENMERVLSDRFCRCGRSPSPEWDEARLAASWMDDISELLRSNQSSLLMKFQILISD